MWRKPAIIGCSIVVEDEKGNILLQRHSYGSDNWALPGGGLKPSEDPANGARREVAEELGIDLEDMELITSIQEELSGCPHTAFIFRGIATSPPVPDQREVIEARFFAPDQLPSPLIPIAATLLVKTTFSTPAAKAASMIIRAPSTLIL